jgi:hypothetical protein
MYDGRVKSDFILFYLTYTFNTYIINNYYLIRSRDFSRARNAVTDVRPRISGKFACAVAASVIHMLQAQLLRQHCLCKMKLLKTNNLENFEM